MTSNLFLYLWIAFIVQIIVIYFLSRLTISQLFGFFRSFVHQDKVVFSLISIIFLPGTFIHESAHFLMAIILLLRVRSMDIFPQFAANQIKLGSVEYEKKDAVRGILVGIAPIFMGLIILWVVFYFKLFPSSRWYLNIVIAYLIFNISSTMFSSEKDLQDLFVVVPIIVIVVTVIYIFNIRLDIIWENQMLINRLTDVIKEINIYLFFSIIIHSGIIIILKCLNYWRNR